MLTRRSPLTSDGCDGGAISLTASDRFDLGSGDSSISHDGEIRERAGKLLDGGKETRRDAERLLCKGPPDALTTQADLFVGSLV